MSKIITNQRKRKKTKVLTKEAKRKRYLERQLGKRRAWAHDVLTQAGFMVSGKSTWNGVSTYYIRKGDEDSGYDFRHRIHIRVSDHDANPIWYDANGFPSVDFSVLIGYLSRDEIEKEVLNVIQTRDKYFESDDFKKVREEIWALVLE